MGNLGRCCGSPRIYQQPLGENGSNPKRRMCGSFEWRLGDNQKMPFASFKRAGDWLRIISYCSPFSKYMIYNHTCILHYPTMYKSIKYQLNAYSIFFNYHCLLFLSLQIPYLFGTHLSHIGWGTPLSTIDHQPWPFSPFTTAQSFTVQRLLRLTKTSVLCDSSDLARGKRNAVREAVQLACSAW